MSAAISEDESQLSPIKSSTYTTESKILKTETKMTQIPKTERINSQDTNLKDGEPSPRDWLYLAIILAIGTGY